MLALCCVAPERLAGGYRIRISSGSLSGLLSAGSLAVFHSAERPTGELRTRGSMNYPLGFLRCFCILPLVYSFVCTILLVTLPMKYPPSNNHVTVMYGSTGMIPRTSKAVLTPCQNIASQSLRLDHLGFTCITLQLPSPAHLADSQLEPAHQQ